MKELMWQPQSAESKMQYLFCSEPQDRNQEVCWLFSRCADRQKAACSLQKSILAPFKRSNTVMLCEMPLRQHTKRDHPPEAAVTCFHILSFNTLNKPSRGKYHFLRVRTKNSSSQRVVIWQSRVDSPWLPWLHARVSTMILFRSSVAFYFDHH